VFLLHDGRGSTGQKRRVGALSYKYDLSIIVHDVVALFRQLRTCPVGSFYINWPSNTFHGSWRVNTAGGRVQVAASWDIVSAQDGLLAGALNAAPVVETAQADMMAQWVGLLRLANQTLLDTGYRPDELAHYSLLAEELAHYPR
jgi:hypothetical protein